MYKIIINYITNFIKCIYHISFCVYCNTYIYGSILCYQCWSQLKFWNNIQCSICGEKIIDDCYNCNINVKTLLIYNDILKYLILKFKYANKLFLGEFFIKLFNIQKYLNKSNTYIILYIPHYWNKQITTTINSSMFLAYQLYNQLEKDNIKCKILHNILIKNSSIRQKDSISYKDRFNISDKYSINSNKMYLIKNQHIILIDDILTTGSTILTCNKLIKSAMPQSLQIFTIGKVFY